MVNKNTSIFLVSLLFFSPLKGQWRSLSWPEKCWAVFHPVAAVKIKSIASQCYRIYESDSLKLVLDSFPNGGNKDAFRHCFFMAAFSQNVNIKKLRRLGKAHEKGNYRQFLRNQREDGEVPDSIGSVMDLYNNELGFTIGKENKTASLTTLAEVCLKALSNGKGRMLKRNEKGQYLNEAGIVLTPFSYLGKWQNDKCLIPTRIIN